MQTLRAIGERTSRDSLIDAVGDARTLTAAAEAASARVAAASALVAAGRIARDALVDATQLVRAERYLARLRRTLAAAIDDELRARAALATSVGVVDLARDRLGRARAEREVIERHFAAWRDRRRKLAERRGED